jgi:hypothetical protein
MISQKDVWKSTVIPRIHQMTVKTAKRLVEEMFSQDPFLSRDWSYVYKNWYSGSLPDGWTCDWKRMPQDLVWRLMPMKNKSFLEMVMEDYIGVMGKIHPIAYYEDGSKYGNLLLFRSGEKYFMLREEAKVLDSVYGFEAVYEDDEEFLGEMDWEKCVENQGDQKGLTQLLIKLYYELQEMGGDTTELR